jgi:hypothetical protein
MKYKVIKKFRDLQDNNHIYNVGDKYPRKNKVKKERIEELASSKNKIGVPVIIEVGEK